MSSVAGPRLCANGVRCVAYPQLGSPSKLRPSNKADVCEQCRRAGLNANLGAHQRDLPVKWEPVNHTKNSYEGRLRVVKQDVVAEMRGAPGGVRSAVEEVRDRHGTDNPPETLPPESDDILYPESVGEAPESIEEYTAWLNDRRRWQSDLLWVLLRGVPEEYLGEKSAPFVVSPPVPARRLPWLRFASALVLCDVPVEEAPVFADYGGLPTFPQRGEEAVLDVYTERELRDRAIVAEQRQAWDEMVFDKMWESKDELVGLSAREARNKVLRLFGAEMEKELEQLREAREEELECDPTLPYYIRYDPKQHSYLDLTDTARAIRAVARLSHTDRRE
jgi:hypothetical protein